MTCGRCQRCARPCLQLAAAASVVPDHAAIRCFVKQELVLGAWRDEWGEHRTDIRCFPLVCRERAATKRLKRQVQKERRGAMRELRKDAAFIDTEREKVGFGIFIFSSVSESFPNRFLDCSRGLRVAQGRRLH